MKRLLATTAVATMAFAGAASAQSVLERVLGQIDNSTNLASVNGTFANIAENIGGAQNVYSDTDGNIYTEAQWEAAQIDIAKDTYTVVPADRWVNLTTGEVLTNDQADAAYPTAEDKAAAGFLDSDAGTYYSGDASTDAEGTVISSADHTALPASYTVPTLDSVASIGGFGGIDGSITNTLDGITEATQQAIASAGVSAIEWNMPTVDLGDMATTALGAVNTGDITLGVNASVDEAKTSTTNAISAVVDQLGGSADTGAIILNVASNMTSVNGSINNVMNEVNGSIGNLSTTALGAVNTGTIVSGVDAAVAGIVGSTSGGAASN